MISLDRGCCQISDLGNRTACCTNHCKAGHTDSCIAPVVDCKCIENCDQRCSHDSADSAFHRLLRTQLRCHLMLTDQHPHTICAGITSPGTDKHQPYLEDTARQNSCLINVRQHHCHIKYPEKRCQYLLSPIPRISKYKNCHQTDHKCHEQQHKPVCRIRQKRFCIQQSIIPCGK